MTPEREAELFSDLKYLVRAVDELGRGQMALREQVARLEGKQDIMLAWLQSTDQRFTAIMAPFQQKPAA